MQLKKTRTTEKTIVCGDAAGCHREAEKTDAADLPALLNEPTMWLGAQDGRYQIQFT